MKRLKYLIVFLLPLTVYLAFTNVGWWTFLPILVYFGFVPVLELLLKPDKINFDSEEEEKAKKDPFYDLILLITIPVQIGFLVFFLFTIQDTPAWSLEFIGRISSMGLMCGVFGINIGHELGHRSNLGQRFFGEILLLTSLEMHFLPYHNSGHHFNVATPNDPATARKGEWLYSFWFRSQFGSYLQAWLIESQRLNKKGKQWFSLSNKMIVYTLAQLALITIIYYFFGWITLIAFLMAATMGILLLETVNYIEHYGLLRAKREDGKYEKVQHRHSWNSDHILGRIFLFELSRHSDHHYKASKHYQLLNSLPDSPQMPTGYPGMMLLALVPPLWLKFMRGKLESNLMD